jgi:hypothetical protein
MEKALDAQHQVLPSKVLPSKVLPSKVLRTVYEFATDRPAAPPA